MYKRTALFGVLDSERTGTVIDFTKIFFDTTVIIRYFHAFPFYGK